MGKLFITALAVALLGLVARTTHADTIQAQFQNVVDNGNGTFTYNYQLVLTNGNGLANSVGDHPGFESGLIILDYYGLVGAPVLTSSGTDITLVSEWNVATPLTGGLPLDNSAYNPIPNVFGDNTFLRGTDPNSTVSGPDHAAVPNVVLQYEGPDELVSGSPRNLIHLALTSTIGYYADGILTLSRDTGPGEENRPVETYSIIGPAVPLPAAAWAGFALFGGLGLKRFRRGGEVESA